jgi:hypothetical protein
MLPPPAATMADVSDTAKEARAARRGLRGAAPATHERRSNPSCCVPQAAHARRPRTAARAAARAARGPQLYYASVEQKRNEILERKSKEGEARPRGAAAALSCHRARRTGRLPAPRGSAHGRLRRARARARARASLESA